MVQVYPDLLKTASSTITTRYNLWQAQQILTCRPRGRHQVGEGWRKVFEGHVTLRQVEKVIYIMTVHYWEDMVSENGRK